ncbi:Golgi-associated kinase 1A isoform X2 [Thalassophryne amazonica]|uniref:Golgi-associated kinase 1A isoform X2 n=1 Tax=Thalassophryne amazonica TaxID=390379 RepID=UPI0014710970|nr:Golgi-associated kinase 1A isoform X2 [Thalassophryne amazonica]
MAWRVWSKRLFVQNSFFLLLLPVFLLFITIFLIILLLPLTPTNVARLPVRALHSTEALQSRPRVNQQPLGLSSHSGISGGNRVPKRSIPPKTFGDAASNQNKDKRKGTTSKSKAAPGAGQPRTSRRPPVPEFIVNSTQPKTRIKLRNHGAVVKHTAQTAIRLERTESLPQIPSSAKTADRKADALKQGSWMSGRRAEHRQDAAKHSGKFDKAAKQQAANKPSRNLKKRQNRSEDLSETKTKPELVDHKMSLTRLQTAVKKDGSSWFQSARECRFPGSDHRSIRMSPDLSSVPWLSNDDIQKMKLLADWNVISKSRVPAHGQVLQVALDGPTPQHTLQTSLLQHGLTHSECCQQGRCALIKRTDDWFEVFAFHLDRVLGLNRSLPMVLRTFRSDILPYRYLSGSPRPIVWWDPDIRHLTDSNNDQNSVPLSWIQYQELLRVHCGTDADLWSAPCVGVQHSEWGRLALFDFLLQVNDRLDRNCCGFTPDPADTCVENLLHHKCHNTRDLLLVHILVRRAEPNRLVFIDNAGRPHQDAANLDFRLIEGIDEFPETAVSVLQSGCLEDLLLRSLFTDKVFWDSRGGFNGLKVLIRTVEQRGRILLQYIKDKKLRLNRDL